MRNNIWVTLSFLLLCLSCKQADTVQNYQLVKSGMTISFPLDNNTKPATRSLFLYTNKEGNEYLTFQELNGNKILFYNMQTRQLDFTIYPQREGNNGVGRVGGYYVHNFDSIFITPIHEVIVLIDSNAIVKDRINYKETKDGIPLFGYGAYTYQPMILLNNKLFITPMTSRRQEKRPLCVVIDLVDKSIFALDAQLPKFANTNSIHKEFGSEMNYSRCFDGNMFIYSFDYDENIYIADINHTTLRNIKAKSRYIDHVENPDDLYLTIEQSCMNPHYDNLVYDPYRQVYYRIAQPRIKWDKGTNVQEFIDYGGKNFSIIILDNNFNVVGETMFPDNTYNPRALFIREDGLYISSSHFKNPDYSDDWFVFQRFDLVKQQL